MKFIVTKRMLTTAAFATLFGVSAAVQANPADLWLLEQMEAEQQAAEQTLPTALTTPAPEDRAEICPEIIVEDGDDEI